MTDTSNHNEHQSSDAAEVECDPHAPPAQVSPPVMLKNASLRPEDKDVFKSKEKV